MPFGTGLLGSLNARNIADKARGADSGNMHPRVRANVSYGASYAIGARNFWLVRPSWAKREIEVSNSRAKGPSGTWKPRREVVKGAIVTRITRRGVRETPAIGGKINAIIRDFHKDHTRARRINHLLRVWMGKGVGTEPAMAHLSMRRKGSSSSWCRAHDDRR